MKNQKVLWQTFSMQAHASSSRIMLAAILLLGVLYCGTDLIAQESGFSDSVGVGDDFKIEGEAGTLEGSYNAGVDVGFKGSENGLGGEADLTAGLSACRLWQIPKLCIPAAGVLLHLLVKEVE